MFPTGKKCSQCGMGLGCRTYGFPDCCSKECLEEYWGGREKLKKRIELAKILEDPDAWWNDPDQLCDK